MAEQDHPVCTRFCQWLLPTNDVPKERKFMLVSEAGITKYINQLNRESTLVTISSLPSCGKKHFRHMFNMHCHIHI